jgi:Transglycosylase SLT domain
MTVYSYAQLEGLWLNAGGSKSLAPTMAAIAEAESGGNSDARNPSGASGLWQILGNPFPGNAFDPATNARMAVAKYKSQGLGAWVTYTSGAYKAYLSGKTTPDGNVPGSPTAANAQAAAAGSADCLLANPLAISVPLLGSLSAGPTCLFSKSNARAFIGAGFVVAGGVLTLAALAVLAAPVAMKAAGPLGKAAEGVGGALLLVPGAEGAGAALVAAGHTARNPARAGRERAARLDAADRKRLGQPRENPALEVRGGTVRESGSDTAARRRRQSASRSRSRRAVSTGQRPASRDETGF